MDLTQDNYTKEEVAEILKGYDTNVEDLTTKLNDASKQTEQIESLTKSNLEANIKLEMVKNGLDEDLFDLVADSKDIDTATKKIQKLIGIKKKSAIDQGYKPNDHTQTDNAYAEAEKKNDVEGMLKNKISKLFL